MSKPLRICLLGAGYIADWHAKAIASERTARVTAVCDQDAFKSRSLADRLGAKAYDSIDAMLATPGEFDAVHVLLPPHLHAMAASKVLRAGVHAFVEKPLGVTRAECEALNVLAAAHGRQLGVSQNFLFVPAYERLIAAIASGALGIIDSIRVTWAKELPQLSFGPFGHWMFAQPANVLMEVGPHNCAQALHAAALASRLNKEHCEPRLVAATCDKAIDLPRGRTFRRWNATLAVGSVRVEIEWSLVPGFDQHRIEVRGSLGNGCADLDRNIVNFDQHTHRAVDLDRAAVLLAQGSRQITQATRNLVSYALGKAGLSKRGNLFGFTLGAAIRRFHEALRGGTPDERVAGTLGSHVVGLCEDIGKLALNGQPLPTPVPAPAAQPAQGRVDALVLGGGGFIGRALVRRLLAAGKSVRVMVRSASDPGLGAQNGLVQAVRGDIRQASDLERAMAGAASVFHLARGEGRTWHDWYQSDVMATKMVAEKCKEAGVRRLVYTSTIAALDMSNRAKTITDDTPAGDPAVIRELYARTKAANERLLLDMHASTGLDVVIARPGIVIGTGSTPFHSGVAKWSYGRVVEFWGRGDNPLPFVLVDDCAAALAGCLDAPNIGGCTFNLVGGVAMTAAQYVDEVERATGVRFQRRRVAAWRTYASELFKWIVKVAVRHHERRIPRFREWKGRGHLSPFDCSKTRQLLQWTPGTDRDEMVRMGISLPARQFIVDAAGVARDPALSSTAG